MDYPSRGATVWNWRSWPDALWLAVIAIAVIVTYQNGMAAPFLLDDEVSILDNESIRRLTQLSSVLWPRTDIYTAGRPLLNLSFALNYAFGGTNVRGYHVINLLIHTAAALTLFGIVRRTLLFPRFNGRFAASAAPVAFAAALLWALHPLQTESVTYISQRAESLMGLLYLCTLYGFIRATEQPGVFWPALTVGCCCAGMMVKEVMVTAPIIVFLFDGTFIAGSFNEAWRRRRMLYLSLAATWLVLFALMFATRIHDRGVGYGFSFAWHQYLRIEWTAVLHYLRLALIPSGLVFDYGEQVAVPSIARVAICGLALGALLVATLVALRRRLTIGFLGCWYFLILAPTSSFLPVAGQPIAENRVYLPLAAISVALTVGAYHVLRRRSYFAVLAIAASLGWLTINRNHDYRGNLALWTDTVRQRPESARAWCYYGVALLQLGRIDEAIKSFQSAIQIRPGYSQAHENLACAFLGQKRIPDAIRHFETAVRLKPNAPSAHNNFGTALFQAGRRDEALQHYQEALRIRPGFADARVNMGIVLAHLGRTAEALALFEETLRNDPANRAARDNLLHLRAVLQQQPATPTR